MTAIVSKGGQRFESCHRRKDGSTFDVDVSVQYLSLDDGRCVCFIRDISERKRLEAVQAQAQAQERMLVQADKMTSLGILVAGMAHEINNPNNLIMLNSDIAMRLWSQMAPLLVPALPPDTEIAGKPLPAAMEGMFKMLNGISGGSTRIRNIVQHLREFARLDPGALTEKVDINDVVRAAALLVEGLIKKSTDKFALVLAPDLPALRGNFQKLEQVVVNLLTNACHSLADRTRAVTVTTGHDADRHCLWVRVSDQGCGIPAAVLPHIFDPFFTTKRDRGGTGLGLPVSYGITREHGGELVFQSEEGLGTTATIMLPLAAPTAPARSEDLK